jgi:hypothetical protein
MRTIKANSITNHNRNIVERFLTLPFRHQVTIATNLSLLTVSDRHLCDEELFREIFKRAVAKGVVEELRDEIKYFSNTDLKTVGTQICPECSSTEVTTTTVEERFPYGQGSKAVDVTALLPLRTCMCCGLEYFDSESEHLRHDAVCPHLEQHKPEETQEPKKS